MRDVVIIDKAIPQWKGNLHLHTDRSPDSTAPYLEVFEEYRKKGFDFCVVTDHEKYWDSDEADREDFLVLAGAESNLRIQSERPWNADGRGSVFHVNLIKDVTRECARPFAHDEIMARCYEQGLDRMNEYLRYLVEERGQLVQMNHPDWSYMEPEILLATENCFAFEVYNHTSVTYVGGQTDDWRWDYCLDRGRRWLATAGDDAHKYGPEYTQCGGGFTMVCTRDFSKVGLVTALKEGHFYPSMGPKIYDMRIEGGVLKMEFSDAESVVIVGHGYARIHTGNHGRGFPAPPGETINRLEWKIPETLHYFRVRVIAPDGKVGWSQPVFIDDLIEHPDREEREVESKRWWSMPRYLDEILSE